MAQPPELALNGRVTALTAHNGSVVAAGTFTMAGGQRVGRIAQWDGAAWHPLGAGIGEASNVVEDLLSDNGSLIAGGRFLSAGGAPIRFLARWNGAAWSPIGDQPTDWVMALTHYQQYLIAAGWFSRMGDLTVKGIAAWDGTSWSDLDGGADWAVFGVAQHGDDLYAAGGFVMMGGVPTHGLARWDGESWSDVPAPFAANPEFPIMHLASLQGQLWVGGLGSLASLGVLARWDGANWYPAGAGLNVLFVQALAEYRGVLTTGGPTFPPGPPGNAFQWNVSQWQPLGGGLSADVSSLSVCGDVLWVGGAFSTAGTTPSPYIARWGCSCYADCNADAALTVADFGCFQTQFVAGHPYADCNGDGALTVQDFGCFQTKFVAGCP